MSSLPDNLILMTDSYKASHDQQYPPNTTSMFSYLESRGGTFDRTVFFGLQYYLKRYLSARVTVPMVEEASEFFKAHGEPFNLKGWMRVAVDLDGKIPVAIRAVDEGSVVPIHNVLMTVESTDPQTFWIVSWIETSLVRGLWYPITVTTQSWHIRKMIEGYLQETADDPGKEIGFKLHDFGARGVSSSESAGVGGMSHLVNFMGSDTVEGVRYANHYYDCPMAGFSIPAAEHSTITAWGKDREVDAYRNMLAKFAGPGSLVAVVSDSYDIGNAVREIWGKKLLQEVKDSGATIVIRPDSGHPATVVLQTLQMLDAAVGCTLNTKGYKVLPPYFRVIQGDGIDFGNIREILETLRSHHYSASNIAFGMGGALLQKVNRDTQMFAYKCSQVTVDGVERPVSKQPVGDPEKWSKAGKLDLILEDGKYKTVHIQHPESLLREVYLNGKITRTTTLEEVRERARRG